MKTSDCDVFVVAQTPEALTQVCGISLLERLLRNLQRLGVREATVITSDAATVGEAVAKPSWARAGLRVSVQPIANAEPCTAEVLAIGQHERILVVSAGAYFDPRLLNALLGSPRPAVLVDSNPPTHALARPATSFLPAYLIERSSTPSVSISLFDWLRGAADSHLIDTIDVDQQPDYLVDLRRNLRPLWFPTPDPHQRALAENLLLEAAQNGTLDLPAIAHRPIETAIVRRLCRTRITPMQITLVTAAVSSAVTILFASGQLLAGTWLALIVGVLDGVDGKQARVKVETTELGKREHVLDYVLELSWWSALAFHFASTGALPNAYELLLLLVGSDLVDRYAKRMAKQRTGRNLDDVAPVDRFVRLIGGRRNIYIWLLAIGLVAGAADKAFVLLCSWGAATAAVHIVRATSIARQPRGA